LANRNLCAMIGNISNAEACEVYEGIERRSNTKWEEEFELLQFRPCRSYLEDIIILQRKRDMFNRPCEHQTLQFLDDKERSDDAHDA